MVRKPKIFLGDLYFQHERCFGYGAEQRGEGFPGLEVEGAVLYLQEYIVPKFTIERFELVISLFDPVFRGFAVDEGAPDDDAVVGGESVG